MCHCARCRAWRLADTLCLLLRLLPRLLLFCSAQEPDQPVRAERRLLFVRPHVQAQCVGLRGADDAERGVRSRHRWGSHKVTLARSSPPPPLPPPSDSSSRAALQCARSLFAFARNLVHKQKLRLGFSASPGLRCPHAPGELSCCPLAPVTRPPCALPSVLSAADLAFNAIGYFWQIVNCMFTAGGLVGGQVAGGGSLRGASRCQPARVWSVGWCSQPVASTLPKPRHPGPCLHPAHAGRHPCVPHCAATTLPPTARLPALPPPPPPPPPFHGLLAVLPHVLSSPTPPHTFHSLFSVHAWCDGPCGAAHQRRKEAGGVQYGGCKGWTRASVSASVSVCVLCALCALEGGCSGGVASREQVRRCAVCVPPRRHPSVAHPSSALQVFYNNLLSLPFIGLIMAFTGKRGLVNRSHPLPVLPSHPPSHCCHHRP